MITIGVTLSSELPLLIIGIVLLAIVGRLWRFFRRLPAELLDIAFEFPRYTKEMAEDMNGYPWSPIVWLRAVLQSVRALPSDTIWSLLCENRGTSGSTIGFRCGCGPSSPAPGRAFCLGGASHAPRCCR